MFPRPRVSGVGFALLALIAVAACASPAPPPRSEATSTPAGMPSPAPTTAPSPAQRSTFLQPQPRLLGFRGDDKSEEGALPRCDPARQLAASSRQEAAAAAGEVALDVIGQLGGHPHAVALRGDRLYVGVGPRVLVFATKPVLRQVATSPLLPGIVKGLAVRDRLLAAALGTSGLALLDLGSDAPTLTSTLPLQGSARAVDLGDGIAYVAAEQDGLVTVDVRDPSQPRALATALDDRSVLGVTATAGTLLVAAGEAGLIALDLSDPGAPAVTGSVVTGGYAFAVAADAKTAYVADGWGGLRIVDLSDLAGPRLLGSVPTAGWAQDVVVDGDLAFVAVGSQGLLIADVSDAKAPRALSTAPLVGRQAIQLAVAGDLAFVVDPFEGLEIVDVAVAASPHWLGTWQPLLEGWDVAPSGDRVFVAAGRSGLRVVDTSDPTDLRDLATAPTVSIANAVAAVGGQVLVSTMPDVEEAISSLLTIDTSDPHEPLVQGAFVLAGRLEHALFPWEDSEFLGTDRRLSDGTDSPTRATSGSTVAYSIGVGVLLVDAASTPCELSYVQTRPYTQYRVGETSAVAIDGRYVFVGIPFAPKAPMPDREPLGVVILDMSDARDPRVVATIHGMEPAGLLVNGPWLYVLGGQDPSTMTVTVVDVDDPAQPRTVGSLPFRVSGRLAGFGPAMAFAAGHLFVAAGDGGLVALDVSDPRRPRLAGRLDVLGLALSVVSDGRHLYVGSDEAGLLVVDPRPGGATAPPPPGGSAGAFWSGIAAPLERPPLAIAPSTSSELSRPPDCVVTSTDDGGPGSLRQCLENARPGDAVGFDPAVFSREHPGTIRLESDLPTLRSGLTIDGGGGVVLDGGGGKVHSSFRLWDATGVTIRGLQIRGFQMGLFVDGSGARGGHTIEGNVIGGNSFDLVLHMTSGNRVAGNYVGLDATGTKLAHDPRADNGFFIQLGASMNLIEGNVFGVQVAVTDPGSYNNSFVGNRFGFGVDGRRLHCRCGLSFDQPFNRAGGAGPGEANIYAGGNCEELNGLCSRIFLQAGDNVVLSSDSGNIWVTGQSSN